MKRHHALLHEMAGMMALQRHSWEAVATPRYPRGTGLRDERRIFWGTPRPYFLGEPACLGG